MAAENTPTSSEPTEQEAPAAAESPAPAAPATRTGGHKVGLALELEP
ncbi:hypothetical protein [Streptomyces sp. NPDC127112]